MSVVPLLTALLLGRGAIAGADQPAPAAATPAAATTSAPAPATPAANTEQAHSPAQASSQSAAPGATATPPADSAAAFAAARDKRLRSAGYKPEVRKGETYYCRSEVLVGTRFPTKTCGTAEQLDQITTNDKEAAQQLQRTKVNPFDK
jgi:hypothetical protein